MERIGIIGLGLKNPYTYAPILRRMGASPAFVWDESGREAEAYADAFGCEPVSDLERFPFGEVDGVIVATVNSRHREFAEPFIARGIPAFVEKPLLHDPDQAVAFAETYRGFPVFSCSPLRFSGAYGAMRDAIRDARADRVLSCDVKILHTMEHFLSNPGKRWHDRAAEGGGMLVDIGIHAVELLHMMIGDEPDSVTYHGAKLRHAGAESDDTMRISLRYLDGATCDLQIICSTDELDYSVEVCTGKARFTNNRFRIFDGSDGSPENAYGGFDGTMAAFLAMIREGIVPLDPDETIRNFRLLRRMTAAKEHTARSTR